MLNPFPQLLTFGFFAPTILRIAAALILLYIGYVINRDRDRFFEISFPIVGKPRLWVLRAAASITILVGLSLGVGYDTQWAAILAMFIALKLFILRRYYRSIIPLSQSAYFLLFVICLSLLLTGAGALAYDLPL